MFLLLISLNTDQPAVLATAKGNKTTGGPEPSGMHILGPFFDSLQGLRTTGLFQVFLSFSFFSLSFFKITSDSCALQI